MGTSVDRSVFDEAYVMGTAPWVIGAPQPAVVDLERGGEIGGAVLDPGCGTGEHTILLTELGYDVLGVDAAPHAIELAEAGAAARGVSGRFAVADALALTGGPYDTVVDSALFHVFGEEDQQRYARSLHGVCRSGATVHVLALADVEPALGPRVPESAFARAFTDGWRVERIRPSTYRGIARGEHAEVFGVADGAQVDVPAYLATMTRS
ncbi:class I SAM-dependent methyltransferase [Saccharopolyspora rhizosphaerae]|uniref:Class I SAM-dependent methyltransferase n=1 Tax=Saccharopolyspora rhizosphaerae TaxID=2492662 RepID=A0A3R8P5K2_9PSEU|nr:class I SAM-dependent methyltransferase [Saccharopolyspora rhizosphaerae]RRO19947.1 class I SAM-dependent methyltransferase [Saccharopolyspora rhizosphaerae]